MMQANRTARTHTVTPPPFCVVVAGGEPLLGKVLQGAQGVRASHAAVAAEATLRHLLARSQVQPGQPRLHARRHLGSLGKDH